MDQGEGGEGAERKRDPADFALWKGQKPGEDTAWDAPWGLGRPGWHIECSAMAEALLGVGFEIHGGGADLIFPHHENEAAQTGAAHGTELAHLWVHNGMVRLDKAKMSKSVGNIFLLHQALDAYGRDALLMYFCGGHYRQPVEFDDERLSEARARVERITRGGPAARARAPRRTGRRHCATGSSTRWPRTSTRRRRSRRCSSGSGRPIAASRAPATPTCATCSACSRSKPARDRRRRGAGRGGRAQRCPRASPGGSRLRRGRPAARRDPLARLGGPRRPRRPGAPPSARSSPVPASAGACATEAA